MENLLDGFKSGFTQTLEQLETLLQAMPEDQR
jgi:hypothetical protein